jgi:hypothetical protein
MLARLRERLRSTTKRKKFLKSSPKPPLGRRCPEEEELTSKRGYPRAIDHAWLSLASTRNDETRVLRVDFCKVACGSPCNAKMSLENFRG